MSNQVCANYAIALYALAGDKAKEYKAALKEIVLVLNDNKDILKILCAYDTDLKLIKDIVKTICKGFDLEYLETFLLLISKKHRFSKLSEISKEFTHLFNENNQIKEGYVYSSFKLNAEEILRIQNSLETKLKSEIELHNITDSSLLGGVKVSIDGKVFDNSLKNSLEQLTKKLLGGNNL